MAVRAVESEKNSTAPECRRKAFFALRRAVLTALRSYERRIISAIRVEPWSFRLHPVFGMESFLLYIYNNNVKTEVFL